MTGTDGIDARRERQAAITRLWSDGAYERVGALFAPATDALVAELDLAGRRVLDAATGTGVLTALVSDRHPELMPATSADPQAWADADGLAGIFGDLDVALALEHRTAWFPFASAEEAFRLFEDASGPVQRLRGAVRADGEEAWEALRAALVARWASFARPAGTGVELPAVYGVAIITVGPRG